MHWNRGVFSAVHGQSSLLRCIHRALILAESALTFRVGGTDRAHGQIKVETVLVSWRIKQTLLSYLDRIGSHNLNGPAEQCFFCSLLTRSKQPDQEAGYGMVRRGQAPPGKHPA